MDFNTIIEALENGELTLSSEELTNIIVQATTKDEHINCDTLKDVISSLQSVKKTAMEDFKEMKKEIENANKADLAKIGKAYWDSLPLGAEIKWQSTGKICEGTKGENKKGSKTAHCILNEIPADSKAKEPKPDRYVKYEKIIVPSDFIMETSDEEVA